MKNHKLSIILLLLIPSLSRAQYFDWVERYTGSEASNYSYTNSILQSETDSEGNLYFVGSCAVDAGFHDNVFLPFTPYGPYWNTVSLVIGKISSEGNLLWSKVINHNNGGKHTFGSIQIIGDTAVSLFVNRVGFSRTSPMDYFFYLDTLLPAAKTDSLGHIVFNDYVIYKNDTLYDYGKFCTNNASTYTVFDLDGNVLENHWLTIALLDSTGEPFKYPKQIIINDSVIPISTVSKNGLPFTVDKNGNIALLNSFEGEFLVFDSLLEVYKKYNIQSPEVSGFRIYINSKKYFDVPLPDVRPSAVGHNYQILKFSPHFEELLATQFLFEPTPEHWDTIGDNVIRGLICDNENNIYLSGYCRCDDIYTTGDENNLKIGGSENLILKIQSFDKIKGFFVKYDTDLNPVYLKQFERRTKDPPCAQDIYSDFFIITQFDDQGNIVLEGGASSQLDTANTSYYYDSIEIESNGSFFMRVEPGNGSLITQGYGIDAADISAGGSRSYDIMDFVASGNRLIWQFKYRWYLNFADSLYEKPREYEWGMGFAVWDYDGNELYFVDYGTNGSSSHATSSVCLVDSVLYLTGMLASGGAQFGDITVPNSGSSQSFIARYVDTAFMHPYVRPGGQQDIQLVVRDGEPVVTVYPNPCAQRVTVDWDGKEPLASAFVTDISGRSYDIILKAAGQGRYTVDFSSMPPANYLLTLVTASGHRITSRLMKR
jgi:hypothetical protein